MDQQLANYLFDEASRTFGFLVKDYSFAPPQLEVDNKINFATVTFMGKNVALECILDEREADITCKVARVVDGKKTPHYAVDENGVRVREGLFHLLTRRGVREKLFTNVGGLELREKIRIGLADFMQMLKKHGQDILADSPDALV
jgi:hypothetical protein